MNLGKLLEGLEYTLLKGSLVDLVEIADIAYDSRQVVPGGMFVCLEGAVVDGHKYIDAAVEKGAVAIMVQHPVEVAEDIAVVYTANTRYGLAHVSAAYFGHPSRQLDVVGITGTKGKTTSTYMIKSILEASGRRTGLIGTIETIIGDVHHKAKNTTPESYELQKLFRQMVDAGCDSVVMEVSSQGLMMDRVACTEFDIGIFTNLSPDHIGPNEHASFEDYTQCKTLLFKMCTHGLFNADDAGTGKMLEGATCSVTTFGMKEGADLRATQLECIQKPGLLGIAFNIEKDGRSFPVEVSVPGDFSVYNALGAVGACMMLGVGEEDIQSALKNIRVRGRVEQVPVQPYFTLIIDYAHNAVSLENLLKTLRSYQPNRLICLFGCGGNRARQRRFDMGAISGRMSDLSIITVDNPRNEEPEDIFKDIAQGIDPTGGKYIRIDDRKAAIEYLIRNAQPGDIGVLAGKGHENYQEIKGVKYPMDEREMVTDIMKMLSKEQEGSVK